MPQKSFAPANTPSIQTVLSVLVAFSATIVARAGSPDWAQWGGPDRNFKCKAKGLADAWPESGPKKLWSRELGDGYSAVVSDGDTLYTMVTLHERLEKNKYALE